MLGGRFSFGDGGWGGTEVGEILPVEVQLGDGQIRARRGHQVHADGQRGLDDFVLQVGANRAETARIWEAMPPILGTNRFGQPKALAAILATTPSNPSRALLMSLDVGQEPRARLRRRYLGLGTRHRGGPARPSQVLEADDLLAVAQGE